VAGRGANASKVSGAIALVCVADDAFCSCSQSDAPIQLIRHWRGVAIHVRGSQCERGYPRCVKLDPSNICSDAVVHMGRCPSSLRMPSRCRVASPAPRAATVLLLFAEYGRLAISRLLALACVSVVAGSGRPSCPCGRALSRSHLCPSALRRRQAVIALKPRSSARIESAP